VSIASLQFFAFALCAALLFRLSHAARWRNSVFLLANVAFLATFSTHLLLWMPMACFLAGGYLGIRILQRTNGGWWFVGFLSATIAAFFWLKKYSFLPDSILIAAPYATIGLSYMFFRLAHLLIDTHGRDLKAPIGPVSYLNYMLNFTTLVSGPIQRFQDFANWDVEQRALNWRLVGQSLERIVVGFFKVAIVSALLYSLHLRALGAPSARDGLLQREAYVCVVGGAYAIYLYYNFSGYMDIVIGVARFFGLTLPENFNKPFSANNFLDFWRRWHMTLSDWLRFYVYNPLLQKLITTFPSPALTPLHGVVAVFATFFLIGLWHGQTGVFAIYGLLLGLGVSGNMLYQIAMTSALGRRDYRAIAGSFSYQMAARGLTFAWVSLSLFCFWADWDQLRVIGASLGAGGAVMAFAMLAIVAGIAYAAFEIVVRLAGNFWIATGPALMSRYARTVYATTMVTVVLCTILLLTQSAPTIVYEKF